VGADISPKSVDSRFDPLRKSGGPKCCARRIGVLMINPGSDPEGQTWVWIFREEIQKLGWTEGKNIRMDIRWATPGDVEAMPRLAKELVSQKPDLILSQGTPSTVARGAGVGRCFGSHPRAKVSMMMMRPPQQGHGCSSTRCSSVALVGSGSFAGDGTPSFHQLRTYRPISLCERCATALNRFASRARLRRPSRR
jgi:hypothetical protein